jgi:serine/threonine-protein phosphatase 2B catalytic subunit
MDSFDLFPLSCVVNGKFIALHGGISPEMKTVTVIYLLFAIVRGRQENRSFS